MIEYLCMCGGVIETYNEKAMMNDCDCPWGPSEHLVIYFNYVKQVMKQLTEASICSSSNKCHDCALIAFKMFDDFDKIINDWDKKLTVTQTYDELKSFIAEEYAIIKIKVEECSAKVTGFHLAVNFKEKKPTLEDYATATGKMVTAVTNMTKIKLMITTNNELMKQFLIVVKVQATNMPTMNPTTNQTITPQREKINAIASVSNAGQASIAVVIITVGIWRSIHWNASKDVNWIPRKKNESAWGRLQM